MPDGQRDTANAKSFSFSTRERLNESKIRNHLDGWCGRDSRARYGCGSGCKKAGVQTEKSWTDALNESVVTSRELRDLHLTPRRKLLGEWFAEGDCGFIFAFRGVGKTWLALAIAQALSTGGKLGEWKANEAVKGAVHGRRDARRSNA